MGRKIQYIIENCAAYGQFLFFVSTAIVNPKVMPAPTIRFVYKALFRCQNI